MSTARVGSALAALLLLFGGAWLIGHTTRSTAARTSGSTSSLPSASVQRVGVAVGDLPGTVVLPSLAAAHKPPSVKTAPVSAQTTAPGSSQPVTSQSSSPAPAQTYTPPRSSGSSGASQGSQPQQKKAPPPVVGGNN